MSNTSRTSGGSDAPSSADSPKPHGEKLSSAVPSTARTKRPGEADSGSDQTPSSGDSPKPHGDKLPSAVQAAAKESKPDQGEG